VIEKDTYRVGVSKKGRKTVIERVTLYLVKTRNLAIVDSQAIRAKLLRQLEGIFELAISIAKGKVKRLRDENGSEYTLTPKQREKWARIAAYTAQVMHNLTRGFDEKQFQTDLKKLEEMVNEVRRRQAQKTDRTVV
jgi:UDP-galactopyranose mutase